MGEVATGTNSEVETAAACKGRVVDGYYTGQLSHVVSH